jgi:hypothetical protein
MYPGTECAVPRMIFPPAVVLMSANEFCPVAAYERFVAPAEEIRAGTASRLLTALRFRA